MVGYETTKQRIRKEKNCEEVSLVEGGKEGIDVVVCCQNSMKIMSFIYSWGEL